MGCAQPFLLKQKTPKIHSNNIQFDLKMKINDEKEKKMKKFSVMK